MSMKSYIPPDGVLTKCAIPLFSRKSKTKYEQDK